MDKLILHTSSLSNSDKLYFEKQFQVPLQRFSHGFEASLDGPVSRESLQTIRENHAFDVNILPAAFDPANVKLVVSDMDSTLINIECVDEIADFAGVKTEVSRVTEAAMRGELDFAGSLRERVKLLAGLDAGALQRVYDERLALNPGAEQMLQCLREKRIKFALVSGGFTFFTDRLKKRLALDFALSNVLGIENGKLTGEVLGDIVGAEAKAKFLLDKCGELNIDPCQVIAIGDGANDLIMMSEAGLGVAYHAKPKVQREADCAINYGGLDALLSFVSELRS
ncbi:MAG TPA: phosphoserine phosphatase SerB [Gammaproteobacteria bacterium]|nr:phosphoserine phosphatase SerB [Gammaproteobacteria bacterium]